MTEAPELVLCIPGPWTSREELLESMSASDAGFVYAGHLLLEMETGFTCELVFEGADPAVTAAFRVAGPHWAASEAMADVAGHASVVYLAGKGGTREAAESMMRAGAALVDAGGLGVKVDSTGIAHGPAYWTELCHELHLQTAHRALVVYITGQDVYSCGMHNFGLPEAIVTPVDGDVQAAADLLRTFTHYLFAQAPVFEEGHTFSVSEGAPVYRVRAAPALDYGPDSLFNNPYGVWELEPEVLQKAEKKAGWWNRLRH
ncbi:DUF4261 domain-containing protein [Massilia brevitalea]|uniref:DUF4261 domain-containing protein n=1 Tax=Massilia brevitalea TaxID=442526 RepID=UPI0027384A93|nr:DUF4261 domain-containing protein [Massilia brevitalea]